MSRRRVPHVAQMELSDCGAACLGMTLAYHGRHVPLDELRRATGANRDGIDARALVVAARQYGLRAHGVEAPAEAVHLLPSGSVLHWESRHFVVFERARGDYVEVVDPALGRRRLTREAFERSYTGVAVVCQPDGGFVRSDGHRPATWRYVRPLLGQAGTLGGVLATSVVLRVVALALPVLTGVVVDRIVPRDDRRMLIVVGAALGAVVVSDFFTSLVRSRLLLTLRARLDASLTTDFLRHLVTLPYEFFLGRFSGDVMMRVQSIAEVREILTTSALAALIDGGLTIAYLALLVAISPAIAALVFVLCVAQVVVLTLSWRPTRRLMTENLEAEAATQGYMFELLAGIETVKAAGREPWAAEHFEALFAREMKAVLARGRLTARVESVLGALELASPLVVLVVGAVQVLDGGLSLGTMLAAAALAAGVLEPLVSLVQTGLEVSLVRSYMDRVTDVLDTPVEQDGEGPLVAPLLRGEVEAQGVSFSYGPFSPAVVSELSVHVAPGQMLGIAGRSGAGKSTLAQLLLGLRRPTAGRVLLDGVDLAAVDATSVRRQIGVVTQRPYLFGSSVGDNIAFSDPSLALERIVAAAKLAGVHDEVEAMPMGYETLVGGGGAALSGGQQQRIALARALAPEPVILLLDEATSDLDPITERAVLANLRSLGVTMIVIAHRLSTIADADLILVMEAGRVVERGTHHELLAGGLYREMALGGAVDDGSEASEGLTNSAGRDAGPGPRSTRTR